MRNTHAATAVAGTSAAPGVLAPATLASDAQIGTINYAGLMDRTC